MEINPLRLSTSRRELVVSIEPSGYVSAFTRVEAT
jgi:hypothetical protein